MQLPELRTAETADLMAWGMLVTGVITFATLWFIPAPYGRHANSAFGPPVNAKVAWIVQESPTLFVTALMYPGAYDTCLAKKTNRLLIAMYVIHYIHRTLIFPLRLRGGKPSPLSVPVLAFIFTTYNTYMQMTHLMYANPYPDSWPGCPQFVIGASVFFFGMAANIHADSVLINLRQPGETDYKIPYGGLFRWVTGANFLGEIIEWAGWACAQWSLPSVFPGHLVWWPLVCGFAFFVYTAANLVPRARTHHQWYLDKFRETYPELGRDAVIPGVI